MDETVTDKANEKTPAGADPASSTGRTWPWTPLKKPYSLALRGWSDDGAYTWEDWERDAKAAFPVRYFLQETVPSAWRRLKNLLRNLKWGVIDVFRRPHMIDTRCPGYGFNYRGGYNDLPEKMFCACFALFKEFMETEYPGHVDWEYSEEMRKVHGEMKDLHDWWTNRRWRDHEEHWAEYGNEPKTTKERRRILKRGDELDREDEAALKRLMKIRRYLWT